MGVSPLILIFNLFLVRSQNVTQYIEAFSDELQAVMCNDIRLGGDKCDNQIYGVQDFIDSFGPYFENGIEDASIVAGTVINRLNEKLNLRTSFLRNMSLILQSKCGKHAYDNADTESLLQFTSLYFSGNMDRQAQLPNDMHYSEVYESTISLSASTYKLPNGMSYENEYVEKDARISELLDPTMIQLYETYCKNDAGNDEYCSMYFGTINGVFRQFPGTENSKSDDGKYNSYDPRFRPWYVSAASGGKDVVILVDVSGSMDNDGRLSLAKKAVKSVLNTLGQSSFVNVVAFSSNIYLSCFGEKLVPATSRNIEALLSFVDTLSAGGATNFNKAFNKAFDILGKKENIINCHTSILFLTDGRSDDPSSIISKRNTEDINAVIFSYTLGDGADAEIPRRVARKTNGIYTHINDGDSGLINKMSSYYLYYTYGIPGTNIIITSPYLDFDTKVVMITMAMSVYIDETYFVGVVGTDIPLTFLSDAIGDITIGRKSYSFVMNDESELILHPLIADSFQLFDGDTSEYKPILAANAEPDVFNQSVLQPMLRREYGEINLNAEVKQAAGNVIYNGYIHEQANLLYIYSGVGPSSLSIAIVIYTETDIDAPYVQSFGMKQSLNISNCKENINITTIHDMYDCLSPFNVYHRLDLMLQCQSSWNDKAQILNGSEMNINDEYYNEFFSDVVYSVKYPTYYLQSGLFESELNALSTEPSCNELLKLHELTNRLGVAPTANDLPFGGIRNEISSNVINSIYSLTSLHKFWTDAFLSSDSSFVSIFFGHYQGLHISYPGKIFDSKYNPLIRPWYQRAISYPDLFVWTTPYKHAVTQKLVTGASTVISSPYAAADSEHAFGVLGFNYAYSEFITYWKSAMNGICDEAEKEYCFLLDSSAFLLYYDGMEYDIQHADISHKFFGDLQPTIMQSLLERGFFVNDTNENFKGDTIDISYIVDENFQLNNIATSFAYNTGKYTIYSIEKTNLYLIYVSNYDLGNNIYPLDCPYNAVCSLLQSPGCIRQEEIQKIFIYKHITESSDTCKTLTKDVCIKPETVMSIEKDIQLACKQSINAFGICILKDNQQSDICATNFVQKECDDSINIISVFYLNLSVFIISIFVL